MSGREYLMSDARSMKLDIVVPYQQMLEEEQTNSYWSET